VISCSSSIAQLRRCIVSALERHGIANVIIAGMTCSGKSTLAKKIAEEFPGEVMVLSQDDYYKNRDEFERNKLGYIVLDSPSAFRVDKFMHDIDSIKKVGFAMTPRYNIRDNMCIDDNKVVRGNKINVFEGLHVISLLGAMTPKLMVFVDASVDICNQRRVQRDMVAGIPYDKISDFWNRSVVPATEQWILPQKKNADLLVGSIE
jgi:uridine kinase